VKTRIKKGDTVEVLSGKDRGRRGRVLAVLAEKGKALVEHVNVARKHRKRRSYRDQPGIASIEMPVPMCKLMLVAEGVASRVRIQTTADGRKQRVAIRNGKVI